MSQKAILEFDLEDFDARQAHLRAVKSLDLALTLLSFQEDLRQKARHTNDRKTEDVLTEVADLLIENLDKYSVILEDLIS